jgi:hypothetical protein
MLSVILVSANAQSRNPSPQLSDPGSCTWILLPDPQTYQK